MVPVNYLAVAACAVVAMVVGFLWYGPLFGKQWMKLNGISEEDAKRFRADPKAKQSMYISYAVTLVGAFVTAFVLSHILTFAQNYMNTSGYMSGLSSGFWAWLGFIAPVTLTSVLWDRKPWMLWVLNSGYFLVQLLLMGVILALWA